MKYIQYHEMENLIKIYPDLNCAIESLKLELNKPEEGCDSDEIESLALKRKPFDEMIPSKGGFYNNDKTSSIALKYRKKIEEDKMDAYIQISQELNILQLIQDKLDIGFKMLSPIQKNIIIDKYHNKLDWNDIEGKYTISKSTGVKERREGIEKIMRVARISIVLYEETMKTIDYMNFK